MKKLKNKIYKLAVILMIVGMVSSCWPLNRGSGNGQQLRDGSGNGPCTW